MRAKRIHKYVGKYLTYWRGRRDELRYNIFFRKNMKKFLTWGF